MLVRGKLADTGGGKLQSFGQSLDGLTAGGHRTGGLDPDPSHVLRRRGLERPVQRPTTLSWWSRMYAAIRPWLLLTSMGTHSYTFG